MLLRSLFVTSLSFILVLSLKAIFSQPDKHEPPSLPQEHEQEVASSAGFLEPPELPRKPMFPPPPSLPPLQPPPSHLRPSPSPLALLGKATNFCKYPNPGKPHQVEARHLGANWPTPVRSCHCEHITRHFPTTLVAKQSWRPYLSAVYGEPVDGNDVDLSTLGWFYWSPTLPLRGVCVRLVGRLSNPDPMQEGIAFMGANHSGVPLHYDPTQMEPPRFAQPAHGVAMKGNSFTLPQWCTPTCLPAQIASAVGFFVKVSEPLPSSRIEVTHINYDESGASWFWHTPGSGVFIDLDALRKRGSVLLLHNRGDFDAHGRGKWVSQQAAHIMRSHDIAAVLFRSGLGVPGVPEFIVRHTSEDPGDQGGACPLAAALLSTGLLHPRPCSCEPRALAMNCRPPSTPPSTPFPP